MRSISIRILSSLKTLNITTRSIMINRDSEMRYRASRKTTRIRYSHYRLPLLKRKNYSDNLISDIRNRTRRIIKSTR